jgi:hypothetical protein
MKGSSLVVDRHRRSVLYHVVVLCLVSAISGLFLTNYYLPSKSSASLTERLTRSSSLKVPVGHNYTEKAMNECLKKKNDQTEAQLNAFDPTVIALRSPTFSNITYPHIMLGDYITTGMFKAVFHLKICPDPKSLCVVMRNPETKAPLIIRLSAAKPGDAKFNNDAVAHIVSESNVAKRIRRFTACQSDLSVEQYLDVAKDYAFSFTSRDLLDSPSAASLPSNTDLLKGYKELYGDEFKLHGAVSDLTSHAPGNFSSYTALASFFKSILQGLDIMHSLQIAHCDVKSKNVRKTYSGTALVIDFGLTSPTSAKRHFDPSLSHFNSYRPPERFLDVSMTSTAESYDKFAAGVMLLDWLYYPCMINVRKPNHKMLSPAEKALLKQEWARKQYTFQGVAILENGVDVRDKFSEEFLQSIHSTRANSVHVRDDHYDPVTVLTSLLTCPLPGLDSRNRFIYGNRVSANQKFSLSRDMKSDKLFLDLALRLMAAEPDERISMREAKVHGVFDALFPS